MFELTREGGSGQGFEDVELLEPYSARDTGDT